jgi:hypothetical protein
MNSTELQRWVVMVAFVFIGSAPCSQCNRQSEQAPPVRAGRAIRNLSMRQPNFPIADNSATDLV